MIVHERAIDAAMPIECKKDSLRQNQDGTWKLVLTIAPDGLPDALMKASPGTRYQAAFVEIGDDEEPVKQTKKPKKRFGDYSLAEQAGMRCNDMTFQNWLYVRNREQCDIAGLTMDSASEIAASVVRWLCDVGSRADIGDNMAGVKWSALNAEFETFAGLATEQH